MDLTQIDKMKYICEYLTDQMQYNSIISENNILKENIVSEGETTDIDIHINNSTEICNKLLNKRFDGSLNKKASNEFCSVKNDMINRSACSLDVKRLDVLETSKTKSFDYLISTADVTSLNTYDPNIKAQSTKRWIATRDESVCEFERETCENEHKLPMLPNIDRGAKISEETNKLLERSKSLNKMMEHIKPKTNLFRDLIVPKAVTQSLSDENVSGTVNGSQNHVAYTERISLECSSGYDSFDELSEDECAAGSLSNVISPEGFADDLESSYEEKESYNTWNHGRRNTISEIVNHPSINDKKAKIVVKPNRCRRIITPNLTQQLYSDECVSEDSGSVYEQVQFTGKSPFPRCNVLPNIRLHSDDPERIDEQKPSTKINLDISSGCFSDAPFTIKGKKKQRRILDLQRAKTISRDMR